MKWVEASVAALFPGDGAARPDGAASPGPAQLPRLLEDALSRAESLDELKDLLSAGTLLLYKTALAGNVVLHDIGRAREALAVVPAKAKENAVIGLGEVARAALGLLAPRGKAPEGLALFLLDVDTARPAELEGSVTRVVIETSTGGDLPHSFGEMLRSAYRAAAGPKGLPPDLSDALLEPTASRVTVHVIAGLEDPWVTLLPELLFDLRSLLEHGKRGRVILHLLTRPFPRLRGPQRSAAEEVEAKRMFDEAFVICSGAEELPHKAADFIALSLRVPEVLVPPFEGRSRGALASYGIARAPDAGSAKGQYLSRLEEAYKAAAPSWVPVNPVLSELASEQALYLHPPDKPPPEPSWKICPDLVPLAIEGERPTLCRIQRGLKLSDLKLM